MNLIFSYRWIIIIGMCICFACKGPEGPMGVSGEDYSSLSDQTIQPRVIFTNPLNQTVGPFDVYNSIQIRFNKFMDVGSLKQAISFSADSEHVVLDTSRVTVASSDLMTISAIDSMPLGSFRWKIGKSYTMSVSTAVFDVNGNHLTEPFSISFVPEPYFRVMSVSPKDHAIRVKLNIRPRITFNSQVDNGILSSTSIIPAIEGLWSISADGLTISFYPRISTSRNLDVGTEYQLLIGSSAQDRFGNHLPSEFLSSFTTIPFRVSSTIPWDGVTAVPRTTALTLSFTATVDTHTVRNAITVLPPTGILVSISSSLLRVSVTPASPWLPQTYYTVTVDSTLHSATGKSLMPPFVLHFMTGE